MSKITQLSQNLINKIAAGEVVENPLSVAKELTENAIDAGAGSVTVEIRDGGLTQIRVTDNGTGISPENLPLAFARHATSKIQNFDDLMRVETLGFRGEALSSIAAVSQVEMLTKAVGQIAGSRVEIHGGKVLSTKEIGCADGTTVVVSNLFFNTPARRKFLKKPATEAGYIAHCLERLALGNPSLILRYINNGQIVFQTVGNGDLKAVLLNIYGREVATKTVSVDAATEFPFGEARLCGVVGKPEIARGNRRHATFFINTRYVESRLLIRAVEAAMKTMLPSGKFPLFALNLTMPPDALDVNVHPNKLDVRFSDEEAIFAFVSDAVRDALEEHDLIPRVKTGDLRRTENRAEPEQIPLPFERKPYRNPLAPHLVPQDLSEKLAPRKPRTEKEVSPLALYEEGEIPPPAKKSFFTHYRIFGLFFETYWLVTQGDSIFLIDQHAAHERVLYEDFLHKSNEESVHAQRLLAPIPLRLTPRESQILRDNADIFSRFGFEISDAEAPEILAVPFLMKGPISASFFTEILDKMGEVGFSEESPYAHKSDIIARAACKAAVKGGDRLTEHEARALIEQLLTLENPFTCPHGRPTIIEITKKELERRFKR